MENNVNTSTSTALTVVEKTEEKQSITLEAPILILFGEYLGFETKLITWAEDACTKPNFPQFKKNILAVIASIMLRKIKKDYTNEEIRAYYEDFYEIAIKNWVDKLRLNKYNESPAV